MSNFVLTMVILTVIALVLCSPFITIWAVNTLFGLAIEYTFVNYFAALWLSCIFSGKTQTSQK